MFLGYSILQLLEYGIVGIITPIKRFYSYLRSRIANLEQERQAETHQNCDSRAEVVNGTYHCQEIDLDQKGVAKNWAHLEEGIKMLKLAMKEEIKVIKLAIKEESESIKQETAEMKERMEKYATEALQIKEMLLDGRKHYIL